jgi:hypothetical protein
MANLIRTLSGTRINIRDIKRIDIDREGDEYVTFALIKDYGDENNCLIIVLFKSSDRNDCVAYVDSLFETQKD